jgi:hypothetical protein
MRIVSILALALLIGSTPLSAQVTSKSESGFQPLAAEAGTSADIAVDLLLFGTLGSGLQISKLVTPHVGIRAGATYFSLNRTITQSDVEFDASLKLGSFFGLVDFFPGSRGAFHLTGGLLSNQTKVDAVGTCSGNTVKLNNRSYTCAELGTLSGSIRFPSASPYVGLGFGTPASGSRVHFVMDLGGAFGKPTITLGASNSGSNAQLATDVQAQRDKTQKDVEKYARIYPVIQSGFGIRF